MIQIQRHGATLEVDSGFCIGASEWHALRSVALRAVVDNRVRVSGGPYSRDPSALRDTHVPAVSFLR